MRILIADDEPNLLSTLADILADEGHEVRTAGTGEEVLALLEAQPADVLITDIRMPGPDGLDVLRAVNERSAGTRVIMMSAYALEDVKREALRHGALAVMDKPLDLDALLDLVEDSHHAPVLMLTDDGESRAIATTLKRHGYRVTVADTTHDAIELSQQIRFRVLLIDCALRGATGLEAYLALRPVATDADAIMLTGDDEAERESARAAIERTAFASLGKPSADAELPGLLARLLGQQATGERAKPSESDGRRP